jgi:hypothetical protein
MLYLCEMKSFTRLAFVAFMLYTMPLRAQMGFTPSSGPPMYVPAGTTVVYTTVASMFIEPRGGINYEDYVFDSLPQAIVTPGGISGGWGLTSLNVEIKIKSDTPECYQTWGMMATLVGDPESGNFYLFGPVVFYDTTIIGHAKAYSTGPPTYRPSDSVIFNTTLINNSAWSYFHVVLDSLGKYRTFRVLNVNPPFGIDSISLQCFCNTDLGQTPVGFSPVKAGHYVDTVSILDPLTNDTLPFILIGDAYAAGVNSVAAEANSLRINPNPCDRSAAISLSGEDIEEVTVQNILGERVFESRQEPSQFLNLNTSTLPSGIYFVEVRSGQGQYRQRIIISH